MNLDAIDGKILYVIGRNARLSNTAVAKALRLPREVVNFRIRRLQKQGILQGAALNINPNALGLVHIQLYLRLHGCTGERIREFEEFLKREPNAVLVLKVLGSWDYIITVIYANNRQLSKFIDLLNTQFPEIHELQPLFVIEEQGPGWGMLVPENEPLPQIPSERISFTSYFKSAKPREFFALDATDRKLLTLLGENARAGILEIAKKAGISYRTARAKIAQLIACGVISRFDSVSSIAKLGFTQRTLLLNVYNIKKNEAKARELFASLRYCSRYWRTFGMAQFRINVYTRTTQEFSAFLEKLRAALGKDLIWLEGMENIAQIKRTGFSV